VIISFALLPFGAADWSLKIMGVGVDWLLDIARWTQNLSGSVLTTPALPDGFLVGMTFAGLFLILLQGRGRLLALVPFVFGVISLAGMDTPHILVSNDGGIMAVRGDNHVYVSSLRKDKFSLTTWFKRWNRAEGDVIQFPKQGQITMDNGGTISCDAAVCRVMVSGVKIAYGSRFYELQQDCAWANIVITDIRLPKDFCRPNEVSEFGYYDFMDRGALSIQIQDKPIIRHVSVGTGVRPWK